MAMIEIKVPDIGDLDEVAVIELLVKAGEAIKAEQSLITVESDKASMEIPVASQFQSVLSHLILHRVLTMHSKSAFQVQQIR